MCRETVIRGVCLVYCRKYRAFNDKNTNSNLNEIRLYVPVAYNWMMRKCDLMRRVSQSCDVRNLNEQTSVSESTRKTVFYFRPLFVGFIDIFRNTKKRLNEFGTEFEARTFSKKNVSRGNNYLCFMTVYNKPRVRFSGENHALDFCLRV